MVKCTAVSLSRLTAKAKAKYKGTLITDDHFLVGRQCGNGGPNTEYRNGFAFPACGQHNIPNSCFIASKGRKVKTIAVINDSEGTTHINLRTNEVITQPTLPIQEQKENTMEFIDFARTVSLFGVKANGFKLIKVPCQYCTFEDCTCGMKPKDADTKLFYWYINGRKLVDNDVSLASVVFSHFSRYLNTKYVVVTSMGRVVCFKRDLTWEEMSNCSVKKSNFTA